MVLPLIGAIASIGSALIGGAASVASARATDRATQTATDLQREQQARAEQLLQPSIAAGDTARSHQLGLLGLGGVGREAATGAFQTSPGYEFAFNQGQNAVQGSAAAGGTLFSGRTLKDLARFGQGLANQEFGNYYNRLAGLSGAGTGAAGGLVNAGQASANNLGDIAMRGAEGRTSSYVAGANALTGGLQNLSDLYAYNNPQRMAGFNPQAAAYPTVGMGRLY